jgi:hypothetical protein
LEGYEPLVAKPVKDAAHLNLGDGLEEAGNIDLEQPPTATMHLGAAHD